MNESPAIQGEPDESLLARLRETPQQLRTRLVYAEARRQGISPELALAVSQVENWGADTAAISKAGAVGLMQVMPFWTANESLSAYCGGRELRDPQINICFGVAILRDYLTRHHTQDQALRAYNGSLRLRLAGARYVRLVNNKLKETQANG